MDALLQLSDLRTSFFTPAGELRAVDGVSLALARGHTLGLVGESGCGKTVTALSIMRLVPPPGRIVGGQIFFDGQALTTWTLERPYANPLRAVTLRIPDSTKKIEAVPLPWGKRGMNRADFSWVDLETSFQWQSFRQAIETGLPPVLPLLRTRSELQRTAGRHRRRVAIPGQPGRAACHTGRRRRVCPSHGGPGVSPWCA